MRRRSGLDGISVYRMMAACLCRSCPSLFRSCRIFQARWQYSRVSEYLVSTCNCSSPTGFRNEDEKEPIYWQSFAAVKPRSRTNRNASGNGSGNKMPLEVSFWLPVDQQGSRLWTGSMLLCVGSISHPLLAYLHSSLGACMTALWDG